jgi:chemotaxis signal transduction protein
VPFSGVMPIPDSHPALLGALQYRGKVSRAFDLGAVLGLGPGHLPQRVRLLMVRQTRTSIPMAIAVQPELEEVSSADAEKLQIVDLKMLSRIGRSKPPKT